MQAAFSARGAFWRAIRPVALAAILAFAAQPGQADSIDDDLEGLAEEDVQSVVEFAMSNVVFFLYHEAGHMLISELGLPVLGREEDAVDMLATLLLLHGETEAADQALVDSVDGWILSSQARIDDGEEEDLSGAHALDEQRAYTMTCLMVGKDADMFQESADDLEVSDDRRAECEGEYRLARDSWFGLLDRHTAAKSNPGQFKIRYLEPEDESLKDYAELLRQAEVLEGLAHVLAAYKLPHKVTIAAGECGEANAFWSPDDRQITLCYEMARYYAVLLANNFREN